MEKETKEEFEPHYVLVEQIFRVGPDTDDWECLWREWRFEGDDIIDCDKRAAAAFAERKERYTVGVLPQRVNTAVAEMTEEQKMELADLHVEYGDEFILNVYRVMKPNKKSKVAHHWKTELAEKIRPDVYVYWRLV